ncbi:MAG: hypothetical protein OXH14_07520 [Alphaproteobacteria bacterium]|nr:hypothetical protein [Alphaproteobacteria bacterium]
MAAVSPGSDAENRLSALRIAPETADLRLLTPGHALEAGERAGVWKRAVIGRGSKAAGQAGQETVWSLETSADLPGGRGSGVRDGGRRGPRLARQDALRAMGRTG